jgi:hypothetical protein
MRHFRLKKRAGYGTRREIHYTPKHGSWLNMAEIELNVMNLPAAERRGIS